MEGNTQFFQFTISNSREIPGPKKRELAGNTVVVKILNYILEFSQPQMSSRTLLSSNFMMPRIDNVKILTFIEVKVGTLKANKN